MRKLFFALACAAVCAFSAQAEGTNAWRLAGTTAFPSFLSFTAMAGRLGVAFGNPILPALLVSSQQERLKRSYGRPRTNAGIWRFDYVRPDGAHVSATVYPTADRAATLLLENPGSERLDDGLLRFPAGGERTAPVFAVYVPNGEWAAFAEDAALAKRALADFQDRVADHAAGLDKLRFWVADGAFDARPAKDPLHGFASASGSVTLDDTGVVADVRFLPRAGQKPALTVLGAVESALSVKLPPAVVGEVVGRLRQAEKTSPADAKTRAAALPESVAQAPADVFCRSLYAHVRDVEIPRLRKQGAAGALQQLDGVARALPPSAPGAAVACALWREADGSVRVLARINQKELANYGKAFNAFTAASLAGAAEKEQGS